jgi:hypothetical protein
MLNKKSGIDPKLIKKAYAKAEKIKGKKSTMEYGGSEAEEKYSSKKDKMKHEKGESKKMEAKEKFMSKFKKKKG